jgi:murein DD-endopeptidase MepM/ murein hydrolase activator NlpD
MIWPACNIYKGGVIPGWAKFGARSGKHTGLDICHRYGSPVVAADSGKVRWVGDMKAGGYSVWITHAGGVETRYMHLKPGSILVKRGDVVASGQQIASVGHSGLERVPAYAVSAAKLRSASHLHFEVFKDGTRVDPEAYLGAGGIALAVLLATGAAVLITVYGG